MIAKPEHVRETRSFIYGDAIENLGEVHPIHKYAKVYKFRENIYSIHTPSFDGAGSPWMHLIVGPEKALLIDTGFGIGDLKGLVEELIGDMPVMVTNTHPSIDHSYGNSQFDTIYAFEFAVPVLEAQNEHMWDHLYDSDGKGIWQDFDPADIVGYRENKIISCPNNYIFDLGEGYEVEMIFMPGHNAAHTVFLDKKNRILFGGDAFLYVSGMGHSKQSMRNIPHGEYGTVEAFYDELKKFVGRLDEFDCIFMSHMVMGEDKKLVTEMYEAAKAIMDDPDCNEYVHTLHDGRVNMVKVYGGAAIEYSEDRIFKSSVLYGKRKLILNPKGMIWVNSVRDLGKVYPIQPYAKVYKFRENVYSIYTVNVWSHLVIGPEKALLIDTAFGIGDMKGLVRELIGDMPLIVVNTHTHGDHSLGNIQYDKVYCHKFAAPVLEEHIRNKISHRWKYLYNGNGELAWKDYDEKLVIPFKEYEVIPCENHHIFNLGGDYDVELIFMPGHDAGGCCFLDKKSGILYSGDAILYALSLSKGNYDLTTYPHGEYMTLEAFHDEVKLLAQRMDEIDSVFMSHMMLGESPKIVSDFAEAAGEILANPDKYEYVGYVRGVETKAIVRGLATIQYVDERVYKSSVLSCKKGI